MGLIKTSNNLNGTLGSQFDVLIWYQFCLHPPCTAEPCTQLLLTYFRLLLAERGEEPFNLIKTASCHLLPWHENKTSPLGRACTGHVHRTKVSLGLQRFNQTQMHRHVCAYLLQTHCRNDLKSFYFFTFPKSPWILFLKIIPLNLCI